MDYKPIHFIGEPIEVSFINPSVFEKIPGLPDAFTWRGENYRIEELLSEWHDYRRRGRMSSNMRPEHAMTASRRGSWGVGRDYYRVRILGGKIFDIYYDRAPKNVDDRKGSWFLDKEVAPESLDG